MFLQGQVVPISAGLDGAPEWPAIRSLLPNLQGKRVVDLGCGFGWFARWARKHGAARILGVDLSENMIARAKVDTDDPGIEYVIDDLEQVALPEASFDFAYSSLVFHYIHNFDRLVKAVFRALVPHAHFIFTIEHPIYMASNVARLVGGQARSQNMASTAIPSRARARQTGLHKAWSSSIARSARY